jgi:hypothetical protein
MLKLTNLSWPFDARVHLSVHRGRAGVDAARLETSGALIAGGADAMKAHPLAPHLQRFFTERLVNQLRASPNTIISYRDCTPSAKPAANTQPK